FLGGKVRIASMPILSSMILSKVFHDFREKYPFVTLELIEGSTPEIRKMVEDHQVDFGFTSSPFGDLDAEIVLQDQMVAISKDPLQELPIDLHRTDYKFILCRAGYETVVEELQSEKVKLHGSFIVQQAETVIHFVAEENGIGVISAFVLAATPNDLCRSPVTPEIKMDIGLVANDLDDLTPVATALVNMIREECERSQQAKG
ncbi:MAG: substrate-binding domain-containing protein, partial [Clostridiales bacterium]|nr:substrate-binding domain-containing protein [Clostridiales bacterium]